MCREDRQEAIPANKIKGLSEVKLEDEGRRTAFVAALDKFGGKDEVLKDGAASDEASLVDVNEFGDLLLQPRGEGLGGELDRAILEGDGPER